MMKIILVLLLSLTGMRLSAQQPSSMQSKTLANFERAYVGDAPDSIYLLFADVVKKQLPPAAWQQGFAQIKKMVGGLGAFDRVGSGQGYDIFFAPAIEKTVGVQLSMDMEGRIGGIFVKPNPKPAGGAGAAEAANYQVHGSAGDLAGVLKVPVGITGKIPVVLIIAGSGPTDRDGNGGDGSLRTDMYRQLADSLAHRGIASLRYDKRFVGGSAGLKGRPDSVIFEDFVADARAAVRQLSGDDRWSGIIVVGHSEGALIGAMAAAQEKVSGLVSLAGTSQRGEDVLFRQLSGMTKNVDSAMQAVKRGNERYVASWSRHDPVAELARVKAPVLIVQGLQDLQVERRDAEALKKAQPRGGLVLLDSMNHVLRDVGTDRGQNMASYQNPSLPLDAKLVDAIAGFAYRVATSGLPGSR